MNTVNGSIRSRIGVAALVTLLCGLGPDTASAQGSPEGELRTSGSAGGEVFLQSMIGAASGFVGSVVFGIIGAETIGPDGGEDPGLVGFVFGGFFGATFGSATGVYAAGFGDRGDSSFGTTFAGAAMGTAAFIGIAAPATDPDYLPFWIALYGLPTAGAILTYHASRRPPAVTSGRRDGPTLRLAPLVGRDVVGVGLTLTH